MQSSPLFGSGRGRRTKYRSRGGMRAATPVRAVGSTPTATHSARAASRVRWALCSRWTSSVCQLFRSAPTASSPSTRSTAIAADRGSDSSRPAWARRTRSRRIAASTATSCPTSEATGAGS